MKILIDNGHGVETPGKRSPDGKFREYAFAREIASEIVSVLKRHRYDAYILVPEEDDIPLSVRCRRANSFCEKYGAENVILVSIHANASGMGKKWMNARGWCAFTSRGKTKADSLAEYLYRSAEIHFSGHKIRKEMSDGDSDWEAGFYILKHSQCPAVLTENFFQDNLEDVAYITSEHGKNAIVNCHVDGIINYINSKK